VWAEPDKKHFPSNFRMEALVNLLHYLPIDFEKLKTIYTDCYEYRFDRDFGDDQIGEVLYSIKANDSFEATFQRLMFGETINNRSIQDSALEVMFNHWEDNPLTNVPVDMLVSILPFREVDLVKNLKLLLDEHKIHAAISHLDTTKLVSVGLEPSTIRELDGEAKPEVKYPSVGKIVYGPNIETTSYGANSPITVNVDMISSVFSAIQKEIEENRDLENKEEVSQTVKDLEKEITKSKNPKKVAVLVQKLKHSADWVYQKILANPYVSAIIVELLMKATLGTSH